MDVGVWVNKIKQSVKNSRKTRFKKLQKGKDFESVEEIHQIPQDWQNTLVKNYPLLQRSSSSVSSFASSTSASSTSSSYSVADFLRDLASTEQNYKSRTSTPKASNITSRNKYVRFNNQDISSMKIYDLEDNINDCHTVKRFHEAIENSLYENGEFLKHLEGITDIQEKFDKEDIDDGYEIIVVNSASNWKNVRTLKSTVRK